MNTTSVFATSRGPTPRSTDPGDASVTIAMLSWAWAAVAVDAATPTTTHRHDWTACRWLAAHPADANLAARLAGQLS
jgi:hypothetical protein